jgi:predicted DNA-binding transcriptional regulator YafY
VAECFPNSKVTVMRRTDRLFDLIQTLRDGKLHRAGDMAARLGVSTRTIWRDMSILAAAGLPVQGERGVGYLLRGAITLPPMILSTDEADALQFALALASDTDDPRLARAAKSLAEKLAVILPQGPMDAA